MSNSNKGNYQNTMVQSTSRYHTTPKRTLHWDDEIIHQGEISFTKDPLDFFRFLNEFDSVMIADNALTEGKWKLLYAILKRYSDVASINYCIYENQHGLLFDSTIHSVDTPESSMLSKIPQRSVNEPSDVLARLQTEREQIEIKIKALATKHKEVLARIDEETARIRGVGDLHQLISASA